MHEIVIFYTYGHDHHALALILLYNIVHNPLYRCSQIIDRVFDIRRLRSKNQLIIFISWQIQVVLFSWCFTHPWELEEYLYVYNLQHMNRIITIYYSIENYAILEDYV